MATGSFQTLFTFVSLSIHVLQALSLPACPPKSDAEFDFVVVGAGVGGGPVAARLAESGFSVLVVDAGHDVVNVNTTIPFYFFRAISVGTNYTYAEYSPGAKFPRDDSWYPVRVPLVDRRYDLQTLTVHIDLLGFLKVHNAMVNNIAVTGGDFDNLATMFDDPTWSYENMRSYFKRIEQFGPRQIEP
ncbi:hypothetical protein B0H14DRAFT_3494457 [Mycena olivaceomarginata]|nr:hypothetical protein B0H14DRAFT_3494457 [Mycena olivaceomarginata]